MIIDFEQLQDDMEQYLFVFNVSYQVHCQYSTEIRLVNQLFLKRKSN